MKTSKDKAIELVDKFRDELPSEHLHYNHIEWLAIECAKIAVENEYYSLREQVLRLKPSLEESLYLKLIANLLNEEQEVKNELNKM